MSATPSQNDYSQEVRFAVVMYGGVSLAIYINGIAQEVLRVRPDAVGPQLAAVSRVPSAATAHSVAVGCAWVKERLGSRESVCRM